MESKNMFYKGYVELLVLKLLSEQDRYGYELVKELKERSNNIISLSIGTLYPTLYKLIDQNYLTDYKKQVGKRKVQIYYHIEEDGKRRLAQLIDDYREFASVLDAIIG